jgi:hypothetical protein
MRVSLIMGVPASAGMKMATTILVIGTNEVSHHPQEAVAKQWLVKTVTD